MPNSVPVEEIKSPHPLEGILRYICNIFKVLRKYKIIGFSGDCSPTDGACDGDPPPAEGPNVFIDSDDEFDSDDEDIPAPLCPPTIFNLENQALGSFGMPRALNSVSFDIKPGSIFTKDGEIDPEATSVKYPPGYAQWISSRGRITGVKPFNRCGTGKKTHCFSFLFLYFNSSSNMDVHYCKI